MKRSRLCVAALAILSIFVVPASAQTKSGLDKLYILNCGEGVAGDISRWSPGVDVGKSMPMAENIISEGVTPTVSSTASVFGRYQWIARGSILPFHIRIPTTSAMWRCFRNRCYWCRRPNTIGRTRWALAALSRNIQ